MQQDKNLSRRGFLAAAAGMAAFPQIVQSSTLGRLGLRGANDKINIGVIGAGVMGKADMGGFITSRDCRIIALSDVKKDTLDGAKIMVDDYYKDQDCAIHGDFREMLERPDIDAVLIASPDHWHVLHALAAVRSGKDIYLEKPMGMSIEEITTLRAAVHRYERVFQFGTQQRSDHNFRLACELARNGRIGKLRAILVGVHAGGVEERSRLASYTPETPPDNINYDMWLGPAPEAPYTPMRVERPCWFHESAYSLGYVSGWGIHHMDIAQWGHGTVLTGPVEIQGKAAFPTDDVLCDNPVNWDVDCLFADGVKVKFTGSGPGLEGVRHGVTFQGDAGWVWVNRGAIEASPESLLKETIGPDEVHLMKSMSHHQNFLDCVRSREKTICDIDEAVRSETVCQLAWVAFQTGRKLRWDPVAEDFVGDSGASRMLKRPMRAPWRL